MGLVSILGFERVYKMTKHVFKELKFYFRNDDTWTVNHGEMRDVWISRVTTSYGRIKGV